MAASARQRLFPERITGKISDWKGRFGWIATDFPIEHEAAKWKGGKLFLSANDVEAAISGIGAPVSFFVYFDESGLGAEACRPHLGPPQRAKQVLAPQPRGTKRPAPRLPRERLSEVPTTGDVQNWNGGYGWIRPHTEFQHPKANNKGTIFVAQADLADGLFSLQPGQLVQFHVFADSSGLGAEECELFRPEALAPATPAARQRVTQQPVTGEVVSWQGTSGWLRPHERLEHPLAASGKVSVRSANIAGGGRLQPGQLVQFHVFSSGGELGAEECEVFGGEWPTPAAEAKAEAKTEAKAAAKAKAKAETNAAPKKPAEKRPRERVTQVATTGDLVQWNEGFGWIQPHVEVDHPLAIKRKGRVYLSRSDLAPGTAAGRLQPGQLVKFHIYVDDDGLGAEECGSF